MDLKAYAQISDLEKIAEENDIVVPRLRGYRLMKDESPVSVEDINKIINTLTTYICYDLCCAYPCWSLTGWSDCGSQRADRICNRYLIKGVDENGDRIYSGIRWNKIHGKKRKILKFEIKKKKRMIQEQYETWNRYAGREDVLYIHARIGGANWDCYDGNELTMMSWFLDKADDCYDNTYCDIYALIK